MNDKKNDNNEEKESLLVSGSTLTATVNTPSGDYEFFFDENAASPHIVKQTIVESDIQPNPEEEAEMTETVEIAKTHVSRWKAGIGLKDGIYFEIEKSPKKIVKKIHSKR